MAVDRAWDPWTLLGGISWFIIPTDSNHRTVYAEATRITPHRCLEHQEDRTPPWNKPTPTETEPTPKGETCEADTLGRQWEGRAAQFQ